MAGDAEGNGFDAYVLVIRLANDLFAWRVRTHTMPQVLKRPCGFASYIHLQAVTNARCGELAHLLPA